MRRIVMGCVLALCVGTVALAQLTATVTMQTFTVGTTDFSFEIWARRTNTTGQIFVGTSSFYINYNNLSLGAPSISNENAKFIGDGTENSNYAPMTVDIVAGKVAVTINFTGNLTGSGAPLSVAEPDGERICTVTMPILDAEGSADMSWDAINSAISTSTSSPVTHTFVGSYASPLPVQLSGLRASVLTEMQGVMLTWNTLSEVNNYGFTVQRRSEGEGVFVDLAGAFIAGHGTTVEPQSYSYTDGTARAGRYEYRLRQQDMDGTAHYSGSVQVTVTLTDVAETAPKVFQLHQNYPNPFNPMTQIRFSVETSSHATLKVYNTTGQEVATLYDGPAQAGQYYTVTLDGHSLASGVYMYRLVSGTNTDIKRLVLVK